MREVVALLLAGLLAVAGIAKLFDQRGTSVVVADLGLPRRLGRPAAIMLPALEIALAFGLVLLPTARAAAAATAGLFAVFALVVGAAAARGVDADCGCLGPLSSSRVGFPTAVRCLALAVVAGVLAALPAQSVTRAEVGVALVAGAFVAQSALCVALLRRYGGALRQIEELETVADADRAVDADDAPPAFDLPSVTGRHVTLAELVGRGRPLLLVFVDTGCGACTAVLPSLARWQQDHASRITVAIVGQGDASMLRAAADEHGIEELLLSPDRSLALAYGAFGAPSAVLVDQGRITAPTLYGVDEIASFLHPLDPGLPAERVARV